MSALPETVRSCIDEAIARAPRWLGHAIEAACESLQQDARRGGQDLAAAAAELARERMLWCAAIGGALKQAIAAGEPAGAPGMRVSPSSLTLTLVDDSQVLEDIEAARLAMEIDGAVEKTLDEFNKYMSAALGLEAIQPEDNPLRPAIVARAIRRVMAGSDAEPGRPALWMRHLAAPLGSELRSVYESCTQLLSRAGVRPAGYRISAPAALAREGRASAPATMPAPASSGVVPLRAGEAKASRSLVSNWVELATQAISPQVLREFLFGPPAQAQAPLAPAYYQQVDKELAELEARWDEAPPDADAARQYQQISVVDRPVREVGTDSPLSRDTWGVFGAPRQRSLVRTRLRKQATEVGQVVGLDLVHQLLDQVAQDPRLLAPVREGMVALEPSLARLALHSPRFFAAQDNAARKLLEAVAQRSFRYNDEFATEFRDFFDGVTRCFNALNAFEGLEDAAPFEQARAQLTQAWSRQDAQEEQHRREVVEAVKFAEERQAEADRFAWELSQRTDLAGAPAVVQEFLFGPWSLVIAHARLRSNRADMDPGGYIRVIADLLWSVKRETTLRDPARAFEIIPRVLPTLRSGLDLLGHAPAETQAFFHALERLHRPVLKLRAKHRQASLHAELASAPLDEDLQPAPAQKPQPRDDLWMRDGELRACGFEDTLPSDFALLDADPMLAPAVAQRPPSAVVPARTVAGLPVTAAQAEALIAGLEAGAWVDLFSKQRWRRAQLTWASNNGALFMFVSEGGRPHSMTRRSLQRLVVNRLVRPVASHEVVQHALQALVQPRSEALAA